MKKRSTITDVAKLAGVSIATVSYVLNNTKTVKPATKRKVLLAIKELNYIPNTLAKSLKGHQTKIVGLLISNIANPFFPPIVRGLDNYLLSKGYNTLLSETHNNVEVEKAQLRALLERRIDALAVSLALDEVEHFSNLNIPLLFFNRVPQGDTFNKVTFDAFKGAYIASKHLVQHNYKNIALIVGPKELSTAEHRLSGFKKALEEGGIPIKKEYIKEEEFTFEAGYKAAEELMSLHTPPDAIFASNYDFSIGALKYLKEHNYKIPQDVALIGYDEEPWADLIESPLTLVKYPLTEAGEAIGKRIVELLEAKEFKEAKELSFEPTLVIRKSCGCQ